MSKKSIIDTNQISNTEKEILKLLEKREKCLYGHIFKELNLTQAVGEQAILSLFSKGYIQNIGTSSYYESCIKLKDCS